MPPTAPCGLTNDPRRRIARRSKSEKGATAAIHTCSWLLQWASPGKSNSIESSVDWHDDYRECCSERQPAQSFRRFNPRQTGKSWASSRLAAPPALGGTPIDYQREDFTRVLPGGFDVVFDGIGEDGGHRSLAALRRGGLLCAYGYTAGVQAHRRLLSIMLWMARLYLLRWLPGGKRVYFYSINLMRARHPAWFREDLERLFDLLAACAIQPRVAERISFDEVAEAHYRLEAGGLEGKLVLCPDLPPRRDRAPSPREPNRTSI